MEPMQPLKLREASFAFAPRSRLPWSTDVLESSSRVFHCLVNVHVFNIQHSTSRCRHVNNFPTTNIRYHFYTYRFDTISINNVVRKRFAPKHQRITSHSAY